MTTAVQHRRGTTAEHSTFTGLEGEVTIDTTKDTAVIHDGVLAGGVPLARENLANVTPSGLATITGASTASDDKFFIYDQSATTLKSITRAELNNAMEIDALANVTITGGTINGTTIGNTTAAAGTFTNLTASGTVTIPDNAISGDKVEGGTINAITINTLSANPTLSAGTANGVTYLNGSKVLTSGSALTFDGSVINLASTTNGEIAKFKTSQTYGQVVADNTGATGGGIFVAKQNGVSLTYFGVDGAILGNTSTDTGIYNNIASSSIKFYNDGNVTPKLTLTPSVLFTGSGINVGIGTSSPRGKVEIVGPASETSTLANAVTNAGLLIKPYSSSDWGLAFGSLTGQVQSIQGVDLGGSSSRSIAINALGGNVGIGTSSPVRTLSIANGGPVVEIDPAGGTAGPIYFNYNRSTATYLTPEYWALAHIWNVSGGTKAMTLDSSGNLGIGTTSLAGMKLVAKGANGYPATSGTTQTGVFRISGGSGVYNVLDMGVNESTDTAWMQATRANSLATYDKLVINPYGGNVGIGTTSISSRLHVVTTAPTITTMESTAANGGYLTFSNGSTVPLYIGFGSTLATGLSTSDAALRYSNNLVFSSGSAEKMRIDSSGNLLVGMTSFVSSIAGGAITYYGSFNSYTATGDYSIFNKTTSTTAKQIEFRSANSAVGDITCTSTTTAYNTSSDYRLKEDLVAVADASTRVNALKPVNFAWKADGSRVDGFLAHELAEVVPEAVTGEKDAVDAEGKPVYQGIDQSKLVPLLTAALQEALARIESLEADVATLKGTA